MKTLTTFLAAVAFLLSMQTTAGAVCLEVEMNICVEVPPQSDTWKRLADRSAKFAAEDPDDAAQAMEAMNAKFLCESGYRRSYPALLYVALAEDGSIDRYRIEYVSQSIDLHDPSFTSSDLPLVNVARVIIIRDPSKKYFRYCDVETGETTREKVVDLNTGSPEADTLETPESWVLPFNSYIRLVNSDRSPSLSAASFDRYEVTEPFTGRVEILRDREQVRFYSGDATDPSAVLELTDYKGNTFPLVVEESTSGIQKTTYRFTVKRELDSNQYNVLLKIPHVEQESTPQWSH